MSIMHPVLDSGTSFLTENGGKLSLSGEDGNKESDNAEGIELLPLGTTLESPVDSRMLDTNIGQELTIEVPSEEFHYTKQHEQTNSTRRTIARVIECLVVILIIGGVSFIIRQVIKPPTFSHHT